MVSQFDVRFGISVFYEPMESMIIKGILVVGDNVGMLINSMVDKVLQKKTIDALYSMYLNNEASDIYICTDLE